jgi:hypothetical protein
MNVVHGASKGLMDMDTSTTLNGDVVFVLPKEIF